ncbi:hypothetical protein, partial [Rhizobium phaseoli]|uniref:hypothetical protein n=1 Tax=Rhizobium phaseoli TaxID=396 RepID=UPI0019546AD9
PASCSFSTAIICSSVNLCFFIRPSFDGPDSNQFWRKSSVAGHPLEYSRKDSNLLQFKSRDQARGASAHDDGGFDFICSEHDISIPFSLTFYPHALTVQLGGLGIILKWCP